MRYFVLSLLALVLTACWHSSVGERVATAEAALAMDDFASVRSICDEIICENDESDAISATELGRLSIIYMQLYDRTDDAVALDAATQCYRRAFAVDADSAAHFYTNIPVEMDKYAMSLATLVQSIDNPADISDGYGSSGVEHADSVRSNY